jgi:ferredoxin
LLPGVGALLRWRHVRVVFQSVTFALAALLVADGLFGTRVSPLNLAGVLPWTYWRGIAIVGLVVLGNVSCMACPFVLPRDLARRFLPARRRWPRWLRLKWPSLALIVVYLWAYEAFALWDRPWLTAWIVIAYFAAALIVDGLFRGAAFCKYVCPIGQYQFVHSMLSPTELRVRELDVCRRCTTYDCVRGNDESRGCELKLFLPRKTGNLDCTYCLDCVHACPHDNVGILTRVPAGELVGDPYRSSLGRLSRRPDFAALSWVLVFGAFVNALGMVAPFMQWQDRLSSILGATSRVPVVTLTTLLLLVVLPVATAAVAGWIGLRLGRVRASWLEVSSRFVWTLVPLGGAMWLVHLVFHLATSAGSLGPALGRALSDLGLVQASTMVHAMPARTGWLVPEILVLDVGLLCALYLVWRAAREFTSRTERALGLLGPWALIAASLWAVGIWILFQPMQMRGMLTMTAG